MCGGKFDCFGAFAFAHHPSSRFAKGSATRSCAGVGMAILARASGAATARCWTCPGFAANEAGTPSARMPSDNVTTNKAHLVLPADMTRLHETGGARRSRLYRPRLFQDCAVLCFNPTRLCDQCGQPARAVCRRAQQVARMSGATCGLTESNPGYR